MIAILLAFLSFEIQADSWEALPDGPGGRAYHSTVFTGDEVIVWGGGVDGMFLNDGGALNVRTKAWRPVSNVNAPSGRWFQTAVWTGREMILWGGRDSFDFWGHRMDAGRYDPDTDTWRAMSALNAPAARSQFATVWTGIEMIVWGGMTDGGVWLADGGRYNPANDTWAPIAASPLEARFEPTAVWTGAEMIVFGGLRITQAGEWISFGDGARYNPTTDRWTLLNPAGAPSSRTVHSAVWTGTEMLVWGGRFLPDILYPAEGASYDPAGDSWSPIPTDGAPEPRAGHAAVWNGAEMIVWGGWTGDDNHPLNTGGRYNPVTRSWRPTTLVEAPHPRFFNVPNAAPWTGNAMFVYGGFDYPTSLNSAHLYSPEADSPRDALERLLDRLRNLDLPRRIVRPLIATLEAALRALERGDAHAAVTQLQAFQHKVRAQLGRRGPGLARSLIAAGEAIIDQLEGRPPRDDDDDGRDRDDDD